MLDDVRAAAGMPPIQILGGIDRKYGIVRPHAPPNLSDGSVSVDGRSLGSLVQLQNGIVVRRERQHELRVKGQAGQSCSVSFLIAFGDTSPMALACGN